MSEQNTASDLLDEIGAGRIDRRTLLRRAAVLGLSTPVIAGLLAACGDDDDDEPEATQPPAAPDPTAVPDDDDDEEEPT